MSASRRERDQISRSGDHVVHAVRVSGVSTSGLCKFATLFLTRHFQRHEKTQFQGSKLVN